MARDFYKQILKLDHRNLEAYQAIGDLLYSQGSYPVAGKFYKQGLVIDPQNERLRLGFGDCLFKQEMYAEALRCYFRPEFKDNQE